MEPLAAHHGERLVKDVGEHWIKYVGSVCVALLLMGISILLFLLAGVTAHHYMWLSHTAFIASLFLLLLTFHWFFMMLLSESLDRIIITNRRLLHLKYRILFQEDILEVSFEKMKTVDAVKNGLLQNIFHYGSLLFEGTKAHISLVPHPNRVAHFIQEAMNTPSSTSDTSRSP